ncbi:MAG: hypothetical protein ACKO6N_14050 [Myxococcota bacterium]
MSSSGFGIGRIGKHNHRHRPTRWPSSLHVGGLWLASLLLVSGCKQNDVAPQQRSSADSLTDAAAQSTQKTEAGGGDAARIAGDAGNAPAPAGGPSDAPPGAGTPPAGKPEAIAPGNPGEAPPSGEDIPMGAPPLPDGVKGIHLRGEVSFSDYKAGHIQIDISDRGMNAGGRGVQPKIIQLYRMEKPGSFDIEIPVNTGSIYLSAYNDENKDGKPAREEPRGSASGNPFTVKDADIKGVTITLEREKIPPPPTSP